VRRQRWIAADPDERALPPIIRHVGADRFLWARDFPHSDHGGDYRQVLHAITADLPADASRAVTGENAARRYRLDGEPSPDAA